MWNFRTFAATLISKCSVFLCFFRISDECRFFFFISFKSAWTLSTISRSLQHRLCSSEKHGSCDDARSCYSFDHFSTFSFSNLLANFWQYRLTWTALTFSPWNGTNSTKSTVLLFKFEKLIFNSDMLSF